MPFVPAPVSLYINDMGREISEGIRSALTGDGVNDVAYMLYADDLSLTANDPGEMQVTAGTRLLRKFINHLAPKRNLTN